MERKFTPERIEELKENEIFVFGSNLNGDHAGGAAKLAVDKFGAINGQAIGLQFDDRRRGYILLFGN